MDFAKLNAALVEHVRSNGHTCDGVGDCYISTSIFSLPTDFDSWPSQFEDITTDQIEKTRRAVAAREAFVRSAAEVGYSQDAVFRPPIRDWIIRRLAEQKYRERQVDTSVVALLVRSAITKTGDFHAVITGDADMLPAVRVAYPEFTRNVFVATTHPDEMNPRHRQTAFSLVDFEFDIPPFYMQNKENAVRLMSGAYIHRCEECGIVFSTTRPVPRNQRPRCVEHRVQRGTS